MHSHYDYKMKRNVIILHPGEYYATGDDCLISTVLGSCVAIILYDEKNKIGGMNHFMLPGKGDGTERKGSLSTGEMDGKLGVHAMQLLIQALMDAGGQRINFKSKVFGGGNVLGKEETNAPIQDSDIGASNVRIAFSLLETEKIPVVTSDIRGFTARKIFLDPETGYVYLKRLERRLLEPIKEVELSYLEELEKRRGKISEILG